MRTLKQMTEAEFGALYVWCNSRLNYPKNLATYIGRKDLKIVAPHMLTRDRLQGYEFPEAVYDHALDIRKIPDEAVDFIETRIRPVLKSEEKV